VVDKHTTSPLWVHLSALRVKPHENHSQKIILLACPFYWILDRVPEKTILWTMKLGYPISWPSTAVQATIGGDTEVQLTS